MKNLQLLVIAAIVFGILGILLIYYEESTGFRNNLIIQPILTAISVIIAIYALVQLRKRGTPTENRQTASSIPSSSYSKPTEELTPSPEIRKIQRGILITGITGELIAGAWIFIITEGQSDNWIYPMIFVACVPLFIWAGRYGRIW
jgi:hypothetical protein